MCLLSAFSQSIMSVCRATASDKSMGLARTSLRVFLGVSLSVTGGALSLHAAPVIAIPGTLAVHLYFPASLTSIAMDANTMAARCGNQVNNGVIQRRDCVGR